MKRPLASFFFGIALGIELGSVLDQGDDGAAWQRLKGFRAGVELAELLVVGAIDGGKQHARGVVLWEGDLVAAGARGGRRRQMPRPRWRSTQR